MRAPRTHTLTAFNHINFIRHKFYFDTIVTSSISERLQTKTTEKKTKRGKKVRTKYGLNTEMNKTSLSFSWTGGKTTLLKLVFIFFRFFFWAYLLFLVVVFFYKCVNDDRLPLILRRDKRKMATMTKKKIWYICNRYSFRYCASHITSRWIDARFFSYLENFQYTFVRPLRIMGI